MITQETKSVKTWGGFNLAIFKVNLNPLSLKNRSSYNKTYKPSRASSESTDSFFLEFSTKYKHTCLYFF